MNINVHYVLFSVLTIVLIIIPIVVGYKSKTCSYNGQVYYPGEVDIEPCVRCRCHGDTAQFTCMFKECAVEDDPTCIHYDTPSGQCCPVCMEHGCFYDGKGYPLGSRIPLGPCMYCYCPWEPTTDGQPVRVEATCGNLTCPNAVVPAGHCCPVCPDAGSGSAFDVDKYGYDDPLEITY